MSKNGTFTTVGGLLPRDLLDKVAASDTSLPGTEATSYGLAPGERLNDAITRSWNRLASLWKSFKIAEEQQPESDQTAATITRERWLMPLLDELGFLGGLDSVRGAAIEGKSYAISHQWQTSVPIHLPGFRVPVDRISRGVKGAATSSPHGLMQEFLNRSEAHLWGLVSNGRQLRLLRDNASLTRQAYVEFDLEAMFDGDAYADFVVLWLTCHRSRFEGSSPEACLLEQWSDEAATAGTRALDKLRVGVEAAIATLGEGFLCHPANKTLRESLGSGSLSTTEYHHQLLRTVYRLLFLLVAEGRDLLLDPDSEESAKDRYNNFYSLTRIRTLSTQRRGTVHDDLWQQLGFVFGALSHDGQPLLALKPLGSFLWSPEATSALSTARMDNRHFLGALRHLGQVDDAEAKVSRSIDYRNLGAEELGSVYEALLELHPVVDVNTRSFRLETAAGNERKTTGSYYTPTSLINELLDSALEPVLREASKKGEDAILGLSVIDPACGSGHFLIAAANRIAHRLASVRADGSEPSPEQVRAALRDVVGRCIHGIDINPMAVELCKVSLWLEAMEPGKPLSFLEHRIVCGNALLGTTPRLLAEGVPDDAFKALTGDDKKIVTELRKRNKTERAGGQGTQGTLDLAGFTVADGAAPVAAAIAQINDLPDNTVEDVEAKQRLLNQLRQSEKAHRAKLTADTWCAAFVAPKTSDEPQITTAAIRRTMDDPGSLPADMNSTIERLASEYSFLHLHLAFPDVLQVPDDISKATNTRTGWNGGFDAVLGNPPWERVKLQEKEWFAARDPEIANARNAAARKKLIAALEVEAPELFSAFQASLRQAEGESHLLRNSGKYPLCGRGDVNTYTVFAEGMRDAAGATGRVGVIVPSGIATDDTTKFFFQDIVKERNLASLFDFENSKPIFQGVHRSFKFCLLTLSGSERPVDEAEFVFFATDVADLSDTERRFTLTPEDFELLNPNTRTCPIFRTRRDAEITKGIYRRVPVLVKEGPPEENPWGVKFSTMFHMSNDSHLFRTRDQLEAEGWELKGNTFVKGDDRYLPLYEGKMVGQFEHRAADVVKSETAVHRQAQPSYLADVAKQDPARLVVPMYWVDQHAVEVGRETGLQWVQGYSWVTSPTNERTMITTALPRAGMGNSEPAIFSRQPRREFLLAALGSFAFDYVARQKLGGVNFTFGTLRQLPVPPPTRVKNWDWFAVRLEELQFVAWDMLAFAGGGARAPFRWDADRREQIRAELDARLFCMYGLGKDEVEHIMDSFPIVRRKEEAEYGEYRTKRLVLGVFDQMVQNRSSGDPYVSSISPPPGDPSQRHHGNSRPDWADLYVEMMDEAGR